VNFFPLPVGKGEIGKKGKLSPYFYKSDHFWKDMLVEWRVVRQSTNLLFASFTEDQIKAAGTASGFPISVNALGFIIFGHSLHHLHILKERYDI
jgi:hypothetical protein